MTNAENAVIKLKASNKRWQQAYDRECEVDSDYRNYDDQGRMKGNARLWLEAAAARMDVQQRVFNAVLKENVNDPEFIELAGREGLLDGLDLEDYQ
ncbi:hypothetical protein [Amphritea sp. HPY]|uniref:hypothetical protein n=1 Tax=Amphritea sp. HPY TaxID=3421652 RepID=UPI003D7CAD93